MEAWRAIGLEDFLGHYVGNTAVAETLRQLAPGPLNTDDRTVIEFAFARSVNVINGFDIANLRASTHQAHSDRPGSVEGEIDWSRVDEARLSVDPSLNRAAQFQATLTPDQRIRAAAFVAYMEGDLAGALRRWRAQSQEPKTLSELALLAECLSAEGNDAALPYIDKLAEILPWDAEAIRAEFFWTNEKPREATETLEKFFYALRSDPWPAPALIERSMNRSEIIANSDQSKIAAGRLYNALSEPFCVLVNEAERPRTALTIAIYLDGDNLGQRTLSALEAFEPHVPWHHNFLQVRKTCYNSMHSPRAEQASRDFDEFTKHEASMWDVNDLVQKFENRSSEKPRLVH